MWIRQQSGFSESLWTENAADVAMLGSGVSIDFYPNFFFPFRITKLLDNGNPFQALYDGSSYYWDYVGWVEPTVGDWTNYPLGFTWNEMVTSFFSSYSINLIGYEIPWMLGNVYLYRDANGAFDVQQSDLLTFDPDNANSLIERGTSYDPNSEDFATWWPQQLLQLGSLSYKRNYQYYNLAAMEYTIYDDLGGSVLYSTFFGMARGGSIVYYFNNLFWPRIVFKAGSVISNAGSESDVTGAENVFHGSVDTTFVFGKPLKIAGNAYAPSNLITLP